MELPTVRDDKDDKIVAQFPLYTIADRMTQSTKGVLPSIETLETPEQGRFFAIFTDPRLVRQTMKELKITGKSVLKLTKPEGLRFILEHLEKNGVGYVGIDVNFEMWKAKFYPIRGVLDALPEDPDRHDCPAK